VDQTGFIACGKLVGSYARARPVCGGRIVLERDHGAKGRENYDLDRRRRLVAGRAPAPPLAPPSGTISTTDGRRLISLDFKDADVVNLLRILAAESGRNIVIGDDVKGKMSISLRNVPWEQALDTILETRGLQKIETGNVLRIVTSEQLTREREAQARVLESKVKSEAEARARLAEAQLKEAQALQQKYASEAAVREAEARGPLREETIRLSYADPNEVADTLIGLLGLAALAGFRLVDDEETGECELVPSGRE